MPPREASCTLPTASPRALSSGSCTWQLGDPEKAHRRCLDSLDRARELGHPFSLAYARDFTAWVLIECGDFAGARRAVAALVRESREQGLLFWPVRGAITEGLLLAEAGQVEAGLERMRAAIEEYTATELRLGLPYYRRLYARTFALVDRYEEALQAVDRGIEIGERTGERFWEAELHRLPGDLLSRWERPVREAEACYRRAVEIARAQGASALEARAAEGPAERRLRGAGRALGTISERSVRSPLRASRRIARRDGRRKVEPHAHEVDMIRVIATLTFAAAIPLALGSDAHAQTGADRNARYLRSEVNSIPTRDGTPSAVAGEHLQSLCRSFKLAFALGYHLIRAWAAPASPG